MPWGFSDFDEEFINSLDPVLEEMKKNVDELGQKWLSVLEKVISAYQTDEDLKKFFPQDAIHEECGFSHEGREFLHAISLELLWNILDSKDFEELARRHKFKK